MPLYDYEGMDASGAELTGRIDATSEADANARLRAAGVFVTRLRAAGAGDVPARSSGPSPLNASPVDSARDRGAARSSPANVPAWFPLVLGTLFLAVGSVFLYQLGWRPLWAISQASSWVETPCTIISSELKESPRSRGRRTYRIKIVFDYEFRGISYRSDRYDFVTMGSNTTLADRRGIVKQHPPGKKTVCYVNPANPAEAVINRGWRSEMLWGLFPIPFVLIGLAILAFRRRLARILRSHSLSDNTGENVDPV